MDQLCKSLALLLIAGAAAQQSVEVLDAFLSELAFYEKYKKVIIKLVIIGFGGAVAHGEGLPAGVRMSIPPAVAYAVGGLIVAGIAEGFNSIMKYLSYAKENRKAAAANATVATGTLALHATRWK